MPHQKTIIIDDVKYIRADSVQELPHVSGDFVIVRCRNAGVHCGTLVSRENGVLNLANSRRLWKWWSKFTLSGLAIEGVLESKKAECRFACVLPEIQLTDSDVCEVIPCTDKAQQSLMNLPEYSND